MVSTPILNEQLLDLALQRDLPGFQEAAKRTLGLFELSAWAVIFPPTSGVDGRPVFLGHALKAARGPMLTLAAKKGLDAIFPPQGAAPRMLATLAEEISPDSGHRCRILRGRRERSGEFTLFCFRAD